MRVFSIYQIINTATGKRYIGQTSCRNAHLRFRQHINRARRGEGVLLHSSMRKHGVDRFSFRVIETCNTLPRARDLERRWIRLTRSNERGYGYNLTEGGEGCPNPPADVRAKIAASKRGRPRPDVSARMSGRVVSEETKAKISVARAGKTRPPVSSATRAKLSAALRGKPKTATQMVAFEAWRQNYKPSPESRAKQSGSMRAYWERILSGAEERK